jgi:membrane-associated phospholipid phosphatase
MSSMLAIIPKKVLLLWCACSALFFLLAADVRYRGVVSKMDRPISEAFHNAGTYKSLIFQVGTDLGSGLIAKFTWAMALSVILLRRWHYLPMLWVAVDLGGSINGKMQAFFARQRPRFADLEVLTHPGFPSGHAANATLFFGFLIILALCELKSREARFLAIATATACILFVGLTRVALLAHHTTDVIGSFLWCIAWLIGCYYGNVASYRWSSKNLTAWNVESAGGNEPAMSAAGR